ncbi:hypothetical protein ACIBVL_09810 [Streptomyces sp. NPDC049687]|uniref:hypothetical protein n=1 Tax=Streptomyces sp. NPDC049687 TaxID=3365596 RepID=UPI0037AC6370
MTTAACGSGATKGDVKPSESVISSDKVTAPPAKAPETNGAPAPAGALALAVNPELGPTVTDATGFTLYRFTKDSTNPPKSACVEACAKLWPPVPADGASLPPGLDPALIGSLSRSDGTKQLTVGGMPVYRYAKDTKPGEARGEGVGGTWFASLPKEGVPGLEDALEKYMRGAASKGSASGTSAGR